MFYILRRKNLFRKGRYPMKKTITLGLMMLGLFATSVQAKEVCDTIEECQKLKTKVEARLAELLKDVTPELTGILKTGVDQYEAEKICLDKGMRLPTARELALDAIARKALPSSAISETKKDGYYLVKGSDSVGNPDHFYFSYKDYKRPAGDLGNKWFWSSSVHPYYSDIAYRLYGNYGGIYNVNRSYDNYYNAVRCVQSR